MQQAYRGRQGGELKHKACKRSKISLCYPLNVSKTYWFIPAKKHEQQCAIKRFLLGNFNIVFTVILINGKILILCVRNVDNEE